MKNISFDVKDFVYELPEDKIAYHPASPRDSSKLLVYKTGSIENSIFNKLPDFIPDQCNLIFNNSKVISARIEFFNNNNARIEIFCLEKLNPHNQFKWKCFIGNAKKFKEETLSITFHHNNKQFYLSAQISEKTESYYVVEFKTDCILNFYEILEVIGKTPLPPYIKRKAENSDKLNYQTVYSKHSGSVAAPTAGLHFTDKLLEILQKQGKAIHELTLHVGAGTFTPIKSENVKDHVMHTERIWVTKEFLENLKSKINYNNIAVGTTTVRTLETLYWLAQKISQEIFINDDLLLSQWEPYQLKEQKLSRENVLDVLLEYVERKNLNAIEGETGIIILPSYRIKMADALITNFHQPQSTLLMLISAFVGEQWKTIYDFALKNNYRFLSFGDSSLLWNQNII